MKKSFLFLAFFAFSALTINAQRVFTRDAKVVFDATADNSPEIIIAKNNSGTIIMDMATGKVQASVLMRGFLFERALMQEHFNENYMESSKYPKAVFKGSVSEEDLAKLKKDGTHTLNVKGTMKMHGETNTITTPISFKVKGGAISATCAFNLTLADFGIKIPSLVADKVAKEVKIDITSTLKELKR